MTRTWLTQLHSVVPGRSLNIASSTNATPIVVTRTAATAVNISSTNNGNPDKIVTATAHGLFDGDVATIAGSTGDTAINGTVFVLVVDAFTLQLFTTSWVGIVGNGAYAGSGTLTPWDWFDGDIVTVAGHAVNTNANGTWTAQADSSTVTTLTSQYDLSNSSVGNGIGAATGTIASSGMSYSSLAGVSISGITTAPGGTTSGSPSVRIQVKALKGGNVSLFVQDSVNAFTNFQIVAGTEINAGSGIQKGADLTVVLPFREIARARWGTANAVLRLKAECDANVTLFTYAASIEY